MQAICKKFIYAFYIIKLVIAMRKIRNIIKEKAGVSPIIAIILMVAITVVLAATIYVWVSGMGGGGGGAKLALNLRQINYDSSAYNVTYRVESVSGGPGWEDVRIKLDATVIWDGSNGVPSTAGIDGIYFTGLPSGVATKYTPGTSFGGASIDAGQTITIDASSDIIGKTITIIDKDSGSVIWSAEVHY